MCMLRVLAVYTAMSTVLPERTAPVRKARVASADKERSTYMPCASTVVSVTSNLRRPPHGELHSFTRFAIRCRTSVILRFHAT